MTFSRLLCVSFFPNRTYKVVFLPLLQGFTLLPQLACLLFCYYSVPTEPPPSLGASDSRFFSPPPKALGTNAGPSSLSFGSFPPPTSPKIGSFSSREFPIAHSFPLLSLYPSPPPRCTITMISPPFSSPPPSDPFFFSLGVSSNRKFFPAATVRQPRCYTVRPTALVVWSLLPLSFFPPTARDRKFLIRTPCQHPRRFSFPPFLVCVGHSHRAMSQPKRANSP